MLLHDKAHQFEYKTNINSKRVEPQFLYVSKKVNAHTLHYMYALSVKKNRIL